MSRFIVGHATHPDWRMALALADAQLRAQAQGGAPTLGWCYFGDAYAPHAQALLDELGQRWPTVSWVGCAGFGVAAGEVEYLDEPALALMLADWPRSCWQVFHGSQPLPEGVAASALVHADPQLPDLASLLDELGRRVRPGRLFGGLAWSRAGIVHLADGVWRGGLSGVGFGPGCGVWTGVSQGCAPVGPVRTVTAAMGNLALALDGLPALSCVLADLGLGDLRQPRLALPRLRSTLVALAEPGQRLLDLGGHLDGGAWVRPLVGVDPGREAVAIGERIVPGQGLVFVRRDAELARRDLMRVAAELREAVAEAAPAGLAGDATIQGALYVSCASRGGGFFGGPSAEMRLLRHALADVPLVGFFAAGEVAHGRLHSHTGVLTLFTEGPATAPAR